MNDTINKFLLAGDRFMPEMHLRQPAVFNKNKKIFLETRNISMIFNKN